MYVLWGVFKHPKAIKYDIIYLVITPLNIL